MRNWWLAALAAVVACAIVPAHAAGRTVALVPAQVTNGHPANGDVITEAFRAELEAHGFDVLPQGRVDSAIRAHHIDLERPQTVRTLSALRRAMRADYVVYPRVLSVGVGVSADRVQANVLVNVVGQSRSSFFHTRQLGQLLGPGALREERPVIGDATAQRAAVKLLEGFVAKVR